MKIFGKDCGCAARRAWLRRKWEDVTGITKLRAELKMEQDTLVIMAKKLNEARQGCIMDQPDLDPFLDLAHPAYRRGYDKAAEIVTLKVAKALGLRRKNLTLDDVLAKVRENRG